MSSNQRVVVNILHSSNSWFHPVNVLHPVPGKRWRLWPASYQHDDNRRWNQFNAMRVSEVSRTRWTPKVLPSPSPCSALWVYYCTSRCWLEHQGGSVSAKRTAAHGMLSQFICVDRYVFVCMGEKGSTRRTNIAKHTFNHHKETYPRLVSGCRRITHNKRFSDIVILDLIEQWYKNKVCKGQSGRLAWDLNGYVPSKPTLYPRSLFTLIMEHTLHSARFSSSK